MEGGERRLQGQEMTPDIVAKLVAIADRTDDPEVVEVCREAAAILTGTTTTELVHDADTADLCVLLQKRVELQRGRRPQVTARWVKDMGLLLRRGPKHVEGVTLSPGEVREMIGATFELLADPGRDGFCWADQIRSPAALRDHWEQLEVALRRVRPAKPSDDDMLDAVRRLKAAGL